MTPILNAEEVAALLRCSTRTVEDHARTGKLPGVKFGEGWVFVADLVVEAVKTISLEQAAKLKAPASKASDEGAGMPTPQAVAMPPAPTKTRGRARRVPGLSMLPAVQALMQQ